MKINCRLCDSSINASIIDLGLMPLANSLTSEPNPFIEKFNLEVLLCENCGLAQLKDLVEPDKLFKNYLYFSSNSETMLNSSRLLTNKIIPTLKKNSLVVEIASNDGYLLKNYVNAGIKVLGIEPAENIASYANKHGINTLCNFFNHDLAKDMTSKNLFADVIHANNVMAHVPDINSFISGIKLILKPHGIAFIEVPYLADLFKNIEFDTIYHEHVYYFSLRSLSFAFEKHDLNICDIETLSIHGGSLRLHVCHKNFRNKSSLVNKMITEEFEIGLFDKDRYKEFMQRIEDLKIELQNKLSLLKKSNKKIAGYGASAKGTTLLNFFLLHEFLDFIVDVSSEKQMKFSPGSNLQILPTDNLISKQISFSLLLAWNFADEIIEQQSEYVNNGGKFIIPLPSVKEIP